MDIVTSVSQLHALYGDPGEAAVVKVTPHLTAEYRAMIEASPFVALATCGPEGLDCSPRGDAGSVVHVEDSRTLMLPDRRGNNRIDSLANIVRDPRVALMFLVPGSNMVMRVNGRAVVTVDPVVTSRFVMDGKAPRSVIVMTIEEVYPQNARALMRSELWNPLKFHDPTSLPTMDDMLAGARLDHDGEGHDPDRRGPGESHHVVIGG